MPTITSHLRTRRVKSAIRAHDPNYPRPLNLLSFQSLSSRSWKEQVGSLGYALMKTRDHHRIGKQPVPDSYIDSLLQYAKGRDALDTAYFSI